MMDHNARRDMSLDDVPVDPALEPDRPAPSNDVAYTDPLLEMMQAQLAEEQAAQELGSGHHDGDDEDMYDMGHDVPMGLGPAHYSGRGGRGSGVPGRGGRGGRGRGAAAADATSRVVKKRGPRKAAEPTGDIKLRLNTASTLYLEGRVDEAIEIVEDAIRINAEIHRAWVLLAQLFEERGDYRKGLTARIWACQLEPKNFDQWLECAQRAIELRGDFPNDADEITKQAVQCYSGVLKGDVSHRAARYGRAALTMERGLIKGACRDYEFLVKRDFTDLYALSCWAEAAVLLADSSRASIARKYEAVIEEVISFYRQAVAHYRQAGFNQGDGFDWEHLTVLVELLIYVKKFAEAAYELKFLSRWLLNRDDETFWDDLPDDDREWDEDDMRRSAVDLYQSGRHPISSYGAGLPLSLRAKLAVIRLELRHNEEATRHLQWLDPLGSNAAQLFEEHAHLLVEIAGTLYEVGKIPMALQHYELLLAMPETLDGRSMYRAGKCFLEINDNRRAEECFAAAIESDESDDQASIDARYELAKMYESVREEREALILVREAMNMAQARDEDYEDDGQDDDDDDDDEDDDGNDTGLDGLPRRRKQKRKRPQQRARRLGGEKTKPKARKPPGAGVVGGDSSTGGGGGAKRHRPRVFARREELEKERLLRSAELAEKWQVVRECREQFGPSLPAGPPAPLMAAARELIEDFQSVKQFYSWERYLGHIGLKQDDRKGVSKSTNLMEMAERLSHTLDPESENMSGPMGDRVGFAYRGVPFNEWLDLFLEYATGLAHAGKYQQAYSVCESARDAVMFSNSKDDLFVIHVAWAACALRARDEETCVAIARYFMRNNQFDTDPFRLFSAVSRLCPSPASWYASGPVQKYMLRQIKMMDRVVSGGELNAKGPPSSNHQKDIDNSNRNDDGGGGGDDTQRSYPSKELDVTLLTLYGHVLFISNSFTYALNYFQRAYAVDPTNPMIILSIGQCYVHYALKRQSENRQYIIAQGFIFLHQYYDMRCGLSPSSSSPAVSTPAQRQEAHYNLARTYHAVGLPHLAVEYYQRVLRDVPPRRRHHHREDVGQGSSKEEEEDEEEKGIMGTDDLSKEAAFNLQQICFAGGDLQGMRELGEKYLAL
ncbi:general transcription factor 3C polypeptide 3 (transcription factor C subunit 4) [Microdochium nivale]|nr:general transcription factor 3C polypeptide 3 (transcription factor C subunit 4) [Microdochium nivale]